jgi:hypothetical protein
MKKKFLLVCTLKMAKFIETESRIVFTKDWREGICMYKVKISVIQEE